MDDRGEVAVAAVNRGGIEVGLDRDGADQDTSADVRVEEQADASSYHSLRVGR